MTAGILLLAAGMSRRFGADKRKAQLPSGEQLMESTLKQILDTRLPIRVCLRSDEINIPDNFRSEGIPYLLCPNSDKGMGFTLADGMADLPPWQAVIIALADMPWVQPDTYLAVAHATKKEAICIPTLNGRRGHPVGFGCDFFPYLASSMGERGAKQLVLENDEIVFELEVDDPGIHRDVDWPNDLV